MNNLERLGLLYVRERLALALNIHESDIAIEDNTLVFKPEHIGLLAALDGDVSLTLGPPPLQPKAPLHWKYPEDHLPGDTE